MWVVMMGNEVDVAQVGSDGLVVKLWARDFPVQVFNPQLMVFCCNCNLLWENPLPNAKNINVKWHEKVTGSSYIKFVINFGKTCKCKMASEGHSSSSTYNLSLLGPWVRPLTLNCYKCVC